MDITMLSKSIKTIPFGLILLVLAALSGCGGGSSDAGGSYAGAFTLSQSAIRISGTPMSVSTDRKQININITGKNVAYAGAAYTDGQTPVNWLNFEMSGSGSNYVLTLSVNPQLMSVGVSTASFSVGTTDSKGNLLTSKVVTVEVDLWQALTLSEHSKQNHMVYGAFAETLSVPISFTADNRTKWEVTSSVDWFTFDASSGQGGSNINGIVNTSMLQPGTHNAVITLRDLTNFSYHGFSYQIKLDMPTFEFSADENVIGGPKGIEQNSLPIQFSINTGEHSHAYKLSFETDNGIEWLSADEAEGYVNGNGKTLYIRSIAPEDMTGTFNGKATLQLTVGELEFERVVDVTLNKELSQISLNVYAVALSSAPDQSLLQRQINVFNSVNQEDFSWKATSDMPWLTVTASGGGNQALTVQADPSGLASEQTHYATVTVTSDEAVNTEQIKVGFSILSSVPETRYFSLPGIDDVYPDRVSHAVNPFKPEIVIGFENTLSVYNVYTAEPLYTLNNFGKIRGIAYSVDGSKLFIFDKLNQQIQTLDAETGTELEVYHMDQVQQEQLGLLHIKQNSKSMLLGVPGKIFDTDTGLPLPLASKAITPAGLSLNANYSPALIVDNYGKLYDFGYSLLNGGEVNSVIQRSIIKVNTGGFDRLACFESSGKYIYLGYQQSSFAAYGMASDNIVDYVLPSLNPRAIVCASDGKIVGGGRSFYHTEDIFVYAADGTSLGLLKSSIEHTIVSGGIAVSSDSSEIIALSSINRLGEKVQVKFMRSPTSN
ncbi:BACON domain-containing protein [Arsukibacterium perlucidum]|uniref:BACON domain-containing protein n=1 Tax=Arsukibacterium perlucidum TaxID=368811 RepID=UPI00037CE13E|nr:BACON domain-containing protein [Arsukibacterium perlucidum]